MSIYLFAFIFNLLIAAWFWIDAESRAMNKWFWALASLISPILTLVFYLYKKKPRQEYIQYEDIED